MKISPRLKNMLIVVNNVLFSLISMAWGMVIASLAVIFWQTHVFDYSGFLHQLPIFFRWLNVVGKLIYLLYWNGFVLYVIIFRFFFYPYLYIIGNQQIGLLVPRIFFGFFMSLFVIVWPVVFLLNYFFHKWLDDCPYFIINPDKKISKIVKFLIFKVAYQFIKW